MSDKPSMDKDRRNWLIATSAVGGVGAAAALYPFVDSFEPSERAKAAGAAVEIDITGMKPDEMRMVEWRGKPVYIVRRTAESLAAIDSMDVSILRDADSQSASQPEYVAGSARTLAGKEEYLVLVGLCTHLGCAPMYRPDVGAMDLGGDSWVGGFFCPCHGSKFDLSGRVFAGVPAPTNLAVPPHSYESNDIIIIGIDAEIA